MRLPHSIRHHSPKEERHRHRRDRHPEHAGRCPVTAINPMRAGLSAPRPPLSKSVALPLAVGGRLMAAGTNLHPRAERATVRDSLADMLGSPVWNLSHLLILAGLVMSVGAFVIARRERAFGASVER